MPNNVLRIEDIYMKKRYEAKGIQRKKNNNSKGYYNCKSGKWKKKTY